MFGARAVWNTEDTEKHGRHGNFWVIALRCAITIGGATAPSNSRYRCEVFTRSKHIAGYTFGQGIEAVVFELVV
jgi:hypothetical protein